MRKGNSSSWTLEGVQEDLAAVEQALLAFVTEACPEEEDRDLQHKAACCLIHFARNSPADIHQHNCESVGSKQALTNFPQDVLRSFRALQPLLGPDGVSDALTVLRALHCRMQRLSAVADGQPEAQAPLVVPKVPEADWPPQSTVERPLEAEAAAQHSSAGSCMARRDAPVCREDSAPETADDARPGDAAEQQPPEQRQPSRKASGDRQLMTGAQQSEAEEAPAGAEATAEVMPARAERLSAARAGHDVHALRGEALRQSDLIAELRSRMSSTEEEHAAQVDMLAAVHADQEGLIADLSEELSASRTHCAQLEAKIGNLCGPPHQTGPRSLNRHHTRLDELEAHASHVTELKQELSQAQELLAAQGALLEQKQAALQKCLSQSTHIEATAALREERQRSIIARLREGHACMTAELAEMKDQNMALRISCGELQQLLALQKALTTERDTEILRMRAAVSGCAELDDLRLCQITDCGGEPVLSSTLAHAGPQRPPHCQHAGRPHQLLMSSASASSTSTAQAMQRGHRAALEDTSLLGVIEQLADQEHAQSLLESRQLADRKVAQLKAALAASERHREREAALHKQQMADRASRTEQGQGQSLAPATPDCRPVRPAQGSGESSSGRSGSARMCTAPAVVAPRPPAWQLKDAGTPDTPYNTASRRQPKQEVHTEQDLCAQTGHVDQVCPGCMAWQSHCEALRRQHADAAASSARGMRAELAVLTQQLSEARREAASLADELADSRQVCTDMQNMLSRYRAGLAQPVIPLHDYLDPSPDILFSTEHAQAMSQLSLGATAHTGPGLAHQTGLAAGALPPADCACAEQDVTGMHAAWSLYSKATSVAGSEEGCLPTMPCTGAADIDGMLHSLEAMLKHPSCCAEGLSKDHS